MVWGGGSLGRRPQKRKSLDGRPIEPLDQRQWNEFAQRFKGQNDAGAAVLACAYLECALEAALRARFVEHQRVDDLFDGGNAPLGTFYAKSRAAFALGLISGYSLRDLDIVRDVRNDFAHSLDELSFEAQSVKDRIACLTFRLPPEGNARDFYLTAVAMVLVDLGTTPVGLRPPQLTSLKDADPRFVNVDLAQKYR